MPFITCSQKENPLDAFQIKVIEEEHETITVIAVIEHTA
jgi:hypothetical protein